MTQDAPGPDDAATAFPATTAGGTFTGNVAIAGTAKVGATTADQATVKGIYTSGTIAVTIPTIADAETDTVDVSLAAMTAIGAVGDLVVALPSEALPTDCELINAYMTAADTVTLVFGAKEGGTGVTGAAKNFKFVIFDVT